MNQTRVHHRLLRLLLPVVLGVSMMPLAVTPTVAAGDVTNAYWVDATNGNDANPGTEAEPFKTITRGLASASATETLDTVVVQPGTYDAANGEVFPLVDYGASLLGIQGAQNTVIRGDGTSGLLIAQSFDNGDVISGLTFTGGGVDEGAGVRIQLDSDAGPGYPLIENNVFESNVSSYVGGGLALIANGPGSLEPLVQNNAFRTNSAEQGGAIAIVGGVSATLLGNVFDGNSAYLAGAILALNSDATVVIDTNEFTGNEATLAGAIYMNPTGDQPNSISHNTFADNHADYDGGALFLGGGNVAVHGNNASGDSAEGFGGFARVTSADVMAENNSIVGSRGHEGGAAWHVATGSLAETNDTVVDAVDSPNAVTGELDATIDIGNSTYWNPTLEMDIQHADSVSYSCVSDTLVEDATRGNAVGDGVIQSDPDFSAPGTDDVTLLPGSPCIDSADAGMAPDVDQFETMRPQDGDGDGTAVADMGCFEWASAAAAAATEPEVAPLELAAALAEPEDIAITVYDSPAAAVPDTSVSAQDAPTVLEPVIQPATKPVPADNKAATLPDRTTPSNRRK